MMVFTWSPIPGFLGKLSSNSIEIFGRVRINSTRSAAVLIYRVICLVLRLVGAKHMAGV